MKPWNLLLAIIFLASFTIPADGAESVSRAESALFAFFRPAEARVLTQVGSELVLDQGGDAGLRPGDLMTVVRGRRIVAHPETGESIDALTEYGPYLVIRRIKSELSYCVPLDSDSLVSQGATTRRFGNVPIIVDDTTPYGYRLLNRLRTRFPDLAWQSSRSPAAEEEPPAIFLQVDIHPQGVTVRNHRQQVLFNVPREQDLRSGDFDSEPPGQAANISSGPRKGNRATEELRSGKDDMRVLQRIQLPGEGTLEALRVADLDDDGRAEVLLGIDGDLSISHLEDGRLVKEWRFEADRWDHIIAISVLDLDGGNGKEFVVTALKENRISSHLFRLDPEGRPELLAETKMALAVHASAPGPAILVGVDSTELLDPRPTFYRVNLKGGSVIRVPINSDLPRKLYGAVSIGAGTENSLTAYLTDSGRLRIVNRSGKTLWEMSGGFGGSLHGIKVPQPGSRNTGDYELHRFPGRLEKSSENTILVARHDEPGLFRRSEIYENGRLAEIAWDDGQLLEIASSPNLQGMLVDFDQHDLGGDGTREIVAGIVYQAPGIARQAKSGLVVLGR